jgi:hypothetical protein
MATKKKAAAKKKRAAPGTKARAAAVKKILLSVEKKMAGKELRATLGDYIRLLQLSKEMTAEEPSEITVRWIEDPETPTDT